MRRICLTAFAIALLTVLVSGAPAGAAAAPQATVAPRTHLTHGEHVTVSWTHFRNATRQGHSSIVINQCSRQLPASPTQTDVNEYCDTGTAQAVLPGTATGSASLTIVAGAIGNYGYWCGVSTRTRTGCEVLVWQKPGTTTAIARYAVVLITLAS